MSTWPASLPPPFPTTWQAGYDNRLEASRDLRRNALKQALLRDGVESECGAVLFGVYNHWSRKLAKRLGEPHYARPDL